MPDHQPRSAGRFSHEAEEFVEQGLLWRIDDQPLSSLNNDELFWTLVGLVEPATAKRLIAHCLQLCAERSEPLSVRLAEVAISYLVKPTARNRIHNHEELIKAAAFQARHPSASLRQIAKAAGVDHTLVRQWKQQFAYKAEVLKQLVPYAKNTYAQYVDRFGSPFLAAELPEPDALGLIRMRGDFAKAISLDQPITDLNTLKAALQSPFASLLGERKTV